ncbi:hypothetical protein [Niallia circulans]|uniref:hypothetical protein n=1 Tax=Niallia circulans TaxID=1397 RepID=UPI0026E99BAE|nr:hypothetical protein [Niallia circulans]
MNKIFQCYADSDYIVDLNETIIAKTDEEARSIFEELLSKLNLCYGEIHVIELEIALE